MSSDSSDAQLHGFPVTPDPDHVLARDAVELLLSRFAEELRLGRQPSIEDYARRFPAQGEKIRELFPLVAGLEGWKVSKEVECLRHSAPEELVGTRLGRYRLLRELGRGGMGVVFEAADEESGRLRAVKLMPWRFSAQQPHWKQRFHDEAATIARLRHPHIIQVYAFGTHEGWCYYVMECVAGVSLDRVIARLRQRASCASGDEWNVSEADGAHPPATARPPDNPRRLPSAEAAAQDASRRASDAAVVRKKSTHDTGWILRQDSWDEFAALGLQMAQALAHAHGRGVLHNDIKPANMLLRWNGQLVVTDFGLGGSGDTGVTEMQTGTLRYMAPERLQGECEPRSDIYAWGVTMYELLTRRPPFEGTDRADLIDRIFRMRLNRPRQLVPEIPKALEKIVVTALARDREGRYPSAAALSADLRKFLQGRVPIGLGRAFLQEAWKWLRGPGPPAGR